VYQASHAQAAVAASNGRPAVDRVRFLPAQGEERAMVGGKFTGSNVSHLSGFEVLAEIKTPPPRGQWSEITFANRKVYRWLRYEAPSGTSYRKLPQVEFFAGNHNLNERGHRYDSFWLTSEASAQPFVGIDLLEAATARTPGFQPDPGKHDAPVDVRIVSTPGAVIRYTRDGSMPTANHGFVYSQPLHIEKTTTLEAVAFLDGLAPSPATYATYLSSSVKSGFTTFHLGNSLTQITSQFPQYARTAGYRHKQLIWGRGGAWTKELWEVAISHESGTKYKDVAKSKQWWDLQWSQAEHVDHLTVQPRDFNIAEEADYDTRFFNLFRQKCPHVQPWFYCEWTEMERQRPTDRGLVPSRQMKTLYPALTWEESMGAMLLYMEDLQQKVLETYHEGKRPRVLPTALMMGWMKNLIDHGKIPGLAPGSFYPTLFWDQVHPIPHSIGFPHGNGGYVVDMTWYSAFYRQPPESRVLPLGTIFTPEQVTIIDRLAWDVIKNYPDCDLYEAGATACSQPAFSPAPGKIKAVTPVTFTSSTPGAWFRYTLDGTTPTRTRGYVYCGVVSVRPDMTLKAVAYKSGMADSSVTAAIYAGTK